MRYFLLLFIAILFGVSPVRAANTNVTTTAILTLTNTVGTTNGQTLTIYLGSTNPVVFTWTNATVLGVYTNHSTAGALSITATNTKANSTTNLYVKLTNSYPDRLSVAYMSSNVLRIQSRINVSLGISVSTNWATVTLTTNAIGPTASLSISNLYAKYIELNGTNLNTLLGGGGGGGVSSVTVVNNDSTAATNKLSAGISGSVLSVTNANGTNVSAGVSAVLAAQGVVITNTFIKSAQGNGTNLTTIAGTATNVLAVRGQLVASGVFSDYSANFTWASGRYFNGSDYITNSAGVWEFWESGTGRAFYNTNSLPWSGGWIADTIIAYQAIVVQRTNEAAFLDGTAIQPQLDTKVSINSWKVTNSAVQTSLNLKQTGSTVLSNLVSQTAQSLNGASFTNLPTSAVLTLVTNLSDHETRITANTASNTIFTNYKLNATNGIGQHLFIYGTNGVFNSDDTNYNYGGIWIGVTNWLESSPGDRTNYTGGNIAVPDRFSLYDKIGNQLSYWSSHSGNGRGVAILNGSTDVDILWGATGTFQVGVTGGDTNQAVNFQHRGSGAGVGRSVGTFWTTLTSGGAVYNRAGIVGSGASTTDFGGGYGRGELSFYTRFFGTYGNNEDPTSLVGKMLTNGWTLTNLTVTGLFTSTNASATFVDVTGDTMSGSLTLTNSAGTNTISATNILIVQGANSLLLTKGGAQLIGDLGVTGRTTNSFVLLAYDTATNITMNITNANYYTLSATGNCTFKQPSGLIPFQNVTIEIRQDATGGRLVSFDTNYWRFPSGYITQVTTNANALSYLSCMVESRGTNMVVLQALDFK